MTAGKWSVTRDEDKLWRVWDADGYHRATCYTWGWAMKLADRGSRTVTVTLPRLATEEWTTGGSFRVIPEPPWQGDALEVDELDNDGAYFIIGREDCEPLALALLAHARATLTPTPSSPKH